MSTEIYTPGSQFRQVGTSELVQTGDLPFSLVKPSIEYSNGFVVLLGGHRFEAGDFNTDILTFKITEQRWSRIQKCVQDYPVVIHQTLSIDSKSGKLKSFCPHLIKFNYLKPKLHVGINAKDIDVSKEITEIYHFL